MAGTAGRSGRRPKPTARKELAGNPGKRALNKDEPVFTPIKGAEPPAWFEEEAPHGHGDVANDHQRALRPGHSVHHGSGGAGAVVRGVRVLAPGSQEHRPAGQRGDRCHRRPDKEPPIDGQKEQETEMSSTGAMLGLDPGSRQRLIGLAGQKKTDNPFIKLITS